MLRAFDTALPSAISTVHNSVFCPPCTALSAALEAYSKLQSRIVSEFLVELPLLRERWKAFAGCLLFQYAHGLFTQFVYRRHVPQYQPLKDTGFQLLPEIGPSHFWVSEAVFYTLLASMVLWLVSPFLTEKKNFYTIVVLKRILIHLCCCQTLRIISFSSTVLPGPAHHCLASQHTSTLEWPEHWWQHFVLNLQRQSTKSCGDLIFSSHTTFVLAFVLAFNYYSKFRAGKILSWTAAAILSLLIIASHKHYTVDVTVAWYTVPLVFYTLERRWTTRRGDTKVDNSDSQMKSLREVLVREVGGTHQDNSGPVEASEAPSTAGYAESASGVTKTFHSRGPSHSRNNSASSRSGARNVFLPPTFLDVSPLQKSTLSGSGSLPTNMHIAMERMDRMDRS